MLRLIFILFFCCCGGPSLWGQSSYSIRGTLYDEQPAPLPMATVVLFDLQDSTLADYVLSKDNGQFVLHGKGGVPYQLQISYLGYEPILQDLTLAADVVFDSLPLTPATATLTTAVIEAEHVPMRMRGDTLEFNTAAFSVKAHDKLEDLLVQFPGMTVDANGKIMLDGKPVEKVTIDGKEFFGNQAQIALKNLLASTIKTVQAFDKKTDKEALLDQDASGESKQLNLTLKEEKKTGYMGSVEGGYGYSPDDGHRYNGALGLHYLHPKMRFSIIGNSNNINESGFDYETENKLTGGWGTFMKTNHRFRLNHASLDQQYYGPQLGMTRRIAGGLNANFFPTNRTGISLHYLYANILRGQVQTQENRAITAENFFATKGKIAQNVTNQNHTANVKFSQQLDTANTQKITGRLRFRYSDGAKQQENTTETYDALGMLSNGLEQFWGEQRTVASFDAFVHYQKKFKKKGRALWINGTTGFQNNLELTTNNALTQLYNNGQRQRTDTLLQDQHNEKDIQLYTLEVGYAEPLGEKTSLEWEAVGAWSNESIDQAAFDRRGRRSIANEMWSGQYNKWFDYQLLTTGVDHRIGEKKWQLTAKIGLQRTALKGVIQVPKQTIQQVYYYPMVEAKIKGRFGKSRTASLGYETSIQEPSLDQLQPLLNNQNPLRVQVGNPDLIPVYNHIFYGGYGYNAGESGWHLSARYNLTTNSIVAQQTFDEQLRLIHRPVDGGMTHWASGQINARSTIGKLLKWNIYGFFYLQKLPVLLDDAQYQRWTTGSNLWLSFSNYKQKKIEARFWIALDVGTNQTPENTALNTATMIHQYIASVRINANKGWQLKSKLDVNIYEPMGYKDRVVLPLWSASVSKTLLKDESLKLTLQANNLLNQRTFVERSQWGGPLSETRINILGRFLMFSLSYKIDKMGAD